MTIDRLWMVSEPQRKCSMHHLWHDLLFLHWEVPAEEIQTHLPPRLTVDTFMGKAFVGLVPFRISNIRADGFVPVPGLSTFPEINVRTYVLCDGKDPGVWFFSLDAANVWACIGARLTYKLPYFFANIQQSDRPNGEKVTTEYRSHRHYPGPVPANASVDYTVWDEPPMPSELGTLNHFLVERYLLYSVANNAINVGQVHHFPYRIQGATVEHLEENLVATAGIIRPNTKPLALFARGVEVKVYSLHGC